MNGLSKKEGGSMMMFAQAIGGLNIMEPPEIPTNQSWLPRKFTKSKVKDIMEMSDMMASTLENNTRALTAKINGAIEIITAADRAKLALKEIETRSKLLDLEILDKQYTVKDKSLRCELLEIEIKDAKLGYKMKLKDMGIEDDTETEDRE